MRTHIIEATNNNLNWGKFALLIPDAADWARTPATPGCDNGMSLLRQRGWTHDHVIVFDLQTGEGASFQLGGSPHDDLEKHRIWVCPLFEPFLAWLYQQPRDKVRALELPLYVDLPHVTTMALRGHRRTGPTPDVEIAHGLFGGVTLCGMRGVPAEWPPGHRWVPYDEPARITCDDCRRQLIPAEGQDA